MLDRSNAWIWIGWVALALGCARPTAPANPASAAVAPAEAAVADEPTPFPKLPPEPPTIDHPELRSLTVIARDVGRGFETLVATTGPDVVCGPSLETGGDVWIDGASDPRRPWSGWFEKLPGRAVDGFQRIDEGYLVVRRPLPALGEKQVANLYLPTICRGGSQHFRFALPDADPAARDPRAPAYWADALSRHLGDDSAWARFASARIHELYPEPAVPAAAAAPSGEPGAGKAQAKTKPGQKTRGKAGKAGGATVAAGKSSTRAIAPARPLVPVRRHDPSELARLMETTTGLASLQETLQADRGLGLRGDEAPSVPFAEVKPPELAVHPWPAMLAALKRAVPEEPLAAATPADFYFIRFRSFADLFKLRDRVEGWLSPALTALEERFADYDLRARYEAQLGVGESALTRMLGPSLIQDLALVGSDPYLREGSDLTLILRARTPGAFDAALAATLAENGLRHGGLTSSSFERFGVTVQVSRSADGQVRQHRARAGGFEVISNSPGAIERVLGAITGRAPRLSDEPDFRYLLARDAAVPADALAFMSDRFVASVIGPRQKILAARRQLALAELARPGLAALLYGWIYGRQPASADELVESGLLTRAELSHADGERIDWRPDRGVASSWGGVGSLTPLIDLPAPVAVTRFERDAYAFFVSSYQSYWRAYLDPVAARVTVGPGSGEGLAIDLRVLPIISGTEYSDLLREVGRARVTLGPGRRGVRTTLGLGKDAELRHLLTESSASLPLVGRVAFDWLGDWGLLGLDDTARPRLKPEQLMAAQGFDRMLLDLIELPLYGGVEVKSAAGAAAFLAILRRSIESSAPGQIDWQVAGERRKVQYVAIREAAADAPNRPRLSLYYAFCQHAWLLSLSRTALERRIDECLDGKLPREAPQQTGGSTQWIVETDLRERGPVWAELASTLVRMGSDLWQRGAWARETAEAVARGAPGAGDESRRAIARQTFGAAPVTPEGRDYRLVDGRLQDPLRPGSSAHLGGLYDLNLLAADADSPLVRFARAISHARSEVSFDDEPAVAGAPQARSLHVGLSFAGSGR